jgi:hypothetical protein
MLTGSAKPARPALKPGANRGREAGLTIGSSSNCDTSFQRRAKVYKRPTSSRERSPA